MIIKIPDYDFGEIKNEFAREAGTRVYLLKNANQSINVILKEEIEKNRNK